MLKIRRSCRYCGGFHKIGEVCPRKPKREYKDTRVRQIHSSYRWTEKAKKIKKRDKYLCQACLHEAVGTLRRFNPDDLEVHHIVKLKDDEDLAYEDTNLITLCSYHHKLADNGTLSVDKLRSWISPLG